MTDQKDPIAIDVWLRRSFISVTFVYCRLPHLISSHVTIMHLDDSDRIAEHVKIVNLQD